MALCSLRLRHRELSSKRDLGEWIYGSNTFSTLLLRSIYCCCCSVTKSRLTFVTPWTVAHQAPLSIGFFQVRTLEWVTISFSRVSSLDQGSNLHWQVDYLPLSHLGSPTEINIYVKYSYIFALNGNKIRMEATSLVGNWKGHLKSRDMNISLVLVKKEISMSGDIRNSLATSRNSGLEEDLSGCLIHSSAPGQDGHLGIGWLLGSCQWQVASLLNFPRKRQRRH